jgi:hypothetical protein
VNRRVAQVERQAGGRGRHGDRGRGASGHRRCAPGSSGDRRGRQRRGLHLAIVVAALSIVVNFLWLPYAPWWAGLIIALDAVVIWAVWTWIPSSGWD